MRIIIALLVCTSFQLCAQSKIKPIVSAGYNFSSLRGGRSVFFQEIHLGLGVGFNDHLSLHFCINGIEKTAYKSFQNKNFQIATLSIEPSYRILGDKFMFSPVVTYVAGIEVTNNAKGQFMDEYYFYFSDYDYGRRLYDKGLYFGRAKLMLSFQWKGLDVLVGATYNTYFFRFQLLKADTPTLEDPTLENKYTVIGTRVDKKFGFGFEASLKYAFPMKKHAAKKALEE